METQKIEKSQDAIDLSRNEMVVESYPGEWKRIPELAKLLPPLPSTGQAPTEEQLMDMFGPPEEDAAYWLKVLDVVRGKIHREHALQVVTKICRPEYAHLSGAELVRQLTSFYEALVAGGAELKSYGDDPTKNADLRGRARARMK